MASTRKFATAIAEESDDIITDITADISALQALSPAAPALTGETFGGLPVWRAYFTDTTESAETAIVLDTATDFTNVIRAYGYQTVDETDGSEDGIMIGYDNGTIRAVVALIAGELVYTRADAAAADKIYWVTVEYTKDA